MITNQHWLERWQQNRIGFHESAANRYLQLYLAQFSLAPGATLFLPLCGKAHDIAWLAQQGFEVIGIELSALAIEAFFEEHSLPYQTFESDRFTLRKAGNISIYQGDFFDLRGEDIGECALVYDRAALIAIDGSQRSDYCEQLMSIIPASSNMLLITLEYNQSDMEGPPYAVSSDEVAQFYAGAFSIELLERRDVLDERPRWRQQGLKALSESVFRLNR
jgi:thiopurine S-methyltransferase